MFNTTYDKIQLIKKLRDLSAATVVVNVPGADPVSHGVSVSLRAAKELVEASMECGVQRFLSTADDPLASDVERFLRQELMKVREERFKVQGGTYTTR